MMKRVLTCLALSCVIGFAPVAASAEDAFTPAQKEALGPLIREYLLANPQVVVDSLNGYQAQQENLQKSKFKDNLDAKRKDVTDGGSPFAGNPKGDVIITEFFDYNCGYCKHAVDDIVKLVENDKNVKVIFKDYPILSPGSHEASQWALAAGKQNKYFEYHVKLMKQAGGFSVPVYEKIGTELGLDVAQLRKDATENKEISAALDRNIALANDLGIRGTPAFVIGDDLTPDYVGYDSLKQSVEAVRSKK